MDLATAQGPVVTRPGPGFPVPHCLRLVCAYKAKQVGLCRPLTWSAEQCSVSSDAQANVVYLHNGLLFSHKEE